MEGYSGACRKGGVSADSGRGRFIRAHGKAAFVRQNVCPPGSSGTWSTQSVLCRAEIPSRTEIEGFLSLFFAGWVFAICCGCIWKRTQSRKPFRLAHGSSTLSPHADAPNGAATRRSRLRRAAPAAATERCFGEMTLATTKRLRYARAGGSKL